MGACGMELRKMKGPVRGRWSSLQWILARWGRGCSGKICLERLGGPMMGALSMLAWGGGRHPLASVVETGHLRPAPTPTSRVMRWIWTPCVPSSGRLPTATERLRE